MTTAEMTDGLYNAPTARERHGNTAVPAADGDVIAGHQISSVDGALL
jgi:hypothetical protein